MKTTTLPLKHSMNRSYCPLALLLITLALGGFALSPKAQAVLPAPDGGYPNRNTAEGDDALFSADTQFVTDNTAIGFDALYSNTLGSYNTALGSYALFSSSNTFFNTAIGQQAMFSNTVSEANTAIGYRALFGNTTGGFNTAIGQSALASNTTAFANTATGNGALAANTTGQNNTAYAAFALVNNTTGSNNIALGYSAGENLTSGSNNICIGHPGVASDSNTIRIGKIGLHTSTKIAGISGTVVANGVAVIVDAHGKLGTIVSSSALKANVKRMDKASEAILALKPVTFRYKHDLDPEGIPQFGLVAEEVEKVNPDLVARDEEGRPYTVRYEAVNAMLLNEFLKEHKKVEELEATVGKLQSTIEKVSARLEARESQGRLVDNR